MELNDLWPRLPHFLEAVATLKFSNCSWSEMLTYHVMKYVCKKIFRNQQVSQSVDSIKFFFLLFFSQTYWIMFVVLFMYFFISNSYFPCVIFRWCYEWRASWGNTLLIFLGILLLNCQMLSVLLFVLLCVVCGWVGLWHQPICTHDVQISAIFDL